jgi:hypothetical protein
MACATHTLVLFRLPPNPQTSAIKVSLNSTNSHLPMISSNGGHTRAQTMLTGSQQNANLAVVADTVSAYHSIEAKMEGDLKDEQEWQLFSGSHHRPINER